VMPEVVAGLRGHATVVTADGPRSVSASVARTEDGTADLVITDSVWLTPGQQLMFSYGNGSGLVEFETTIQSLGEGNAVTVAIPRHAKRLQRRDFVRVNVQVPVCLLVPRAKDLGPAPVKGRTRDLSGGGAALLVSTKTPPAKEVGFVFDCEPGLSVAGVAHVIDTTAEDRTRLLMRVRFTQIREFDREALTAWIFRLQVNPGSS
jgi:c-di-GMP-binding flagellar brake protein YcgR